MDRILIVEDDEIQCAMLEKAVGESFAGATIETARNAEDALELIERSVEQGRPYNLFLLDLILGEEEEGGFRVAQRLRDSKTYQVVPILFLTIVSEKVQNALSGYHCYDYIVKPYSAEQVVREIEDMKQRGMMKDRILEIVDINRIRHFVEKDQIFYLYSERHRLHILTKKGEIISRAYTMNEVQERLGAGFQRFHRSYLVNQSYIEDLDRTERYVTVHGNTIPIGKQYLKNI